ncbi:MAG: epoxyqueuosine reductase [Syntrophomonadales bacterium]
MLEKLITDIINEKIRTHNGSTRYRSPLVGFASASDPLFAKLREVANPDHLLPGDMLPEAQSVIAFFLPFTDELIKLNRRDPFVSREWAKAYVETNQLIKDICLEIAQQLGKMGFSAAYEMPTHNFDYERFLSVWSHKHVAYVCGLGSFGRNTMLITPEGCAGRFGSVVTDRHIESETPARELYYPFCEKCDYCVRACPVSALGEDGLDKAACYQRLLEADRFYDDLPLTDACGKCANGPCASKAPG